MSDDPVNADMSALMHTAGYEQVEGTWLRRAGEGGLERRGDPIADYQYEVLAAQLVRLHSVVHWINRRMAVDSPWSPAHRGAMPEGMPEFRWFNPASGDEWDQEDVPEGYVRLEGHRPYLFHQLWAEVMCNDYWRHLSEPIATPGE